jgi:hypothetical protein
MWGRVIFFKFWDNFLEYIKQYSMAGGNNSSSDTKNIRTVTINGQLPPTASLTDNAALDDIDSNESSPASDIAVSNSEKDELVIPPVSNSTSNNKPAITTMINRPSNNSASRVRSVKNNSNNSANNNAVREKLTVDELEQVCQKFLLHSNLITVFHFMTKSHAAHVASDAYYHGFIKLFDVFMEAALANYPAFEPKKYSFTLDIVSDPKDLGNILVEFKEYVRSIRGKLWQHNDLVATCDDILAANSKLIYLLRQS